MNIIFGIVIDGRMCGGKVTKSFRFVCNIILFKKYVVEMKKKTRMRMGVKRLKHDHLIIINESMYYIFIFMERINYLLQLQMDVISIN